MEYGLPGLILGASWQAQFEYCPEWVFFVMDHNDVYLNVLLPLVFFLEFHVALPKRPDPGNISTIPLQICKNICKTYAKAYVNMQFMQIMAQMCKICMGALLMLHNLVATWNLHKCSLASSRLPRSNLKLQNAQQKKLCLLNSVT